MNCDQGTLTNLEEKSTLNDLHINIYNQYEILC